jgi:GT2 family glycosyltransferase
MIIWLASYPRAGSTLLRTILSRTMGIESASDEAVEEGQHEIARDILDARSIGGQWGGLYARLIEGDWDEFYARARQSSESVPIKTHRTPRDCQPAIHVVRDGRSTLLSYLHYHRNFSSPPYPSLLELVLGGNAYGGWSDHYEIWAQQPGSFTARYEQLVNADAAMLQALARRVGHEGPIKPWVNPFAQLQVMSPSFFRKGSAAWVAEPEWTPMINAAFFYLHGPLMVRLGYASPAEAAEAVAHVPAKFLELLDVTRRYLAEKKEMEGMCRAQNEVIDELRQAYDEREVVMHGLPMLDYALKPAAPDEQMAALEAERMVQEGVIERLQRSCEERAALVQRLTEANRLLTSAFVETPQRLMSEIGALERVLVEKQAVIDELKRVCDERAALIQRLGAPEPPAAPPAPAAPPRVRLPDRAWLRPLHIRLHKIFAPHRYPKIGRLWHHDPIPIQPWGMAPATAPEMARDWPLISIVTPSFRQAAYIERTIESVLAQNYPRLEYVIQDGGSTDGTVEIIERHAARLLAWRSARDEGQAQAINLGFAGTTGEIMAWLNSDDLLLPGTLAYVARYFAEHPEVDAVYGNRILIDEHDREIGRWILPRHDDGVLPWADFVPQETLFWRRTLWDKVGGGVDESFRFAMDWDLLLRFRKAGASMVRLPYCLGAFRIHEAQKTSAAINDIGAQEMGRLRLRELGREVGHEEIRHALRRYAAAHMLHDLACRLRRRMRRKPYRMRQQDAKA